MKRRNVPITAASITRPELVRLALMPATCGSSKPGRRRIDRVARALRVLQPKSSPSFRLGCSAELRCFSAASILFNPAAVPRNKPPKAAPMARYVANNPARTRGRFPPWSRSRNQSQRGGVASGFGAGGRFRSKLLHCARCWLISSSFARICSSSVRMARNLWMRFPPVKRRFCPELS